VEAYLGFAEVYDKFMDNVPYDEWVLYLIGLLKENGVKGGLVAELGCGTGNVTTRLKAAGYDMIGIDNSYDMLDVAMEKKYASGNDILYLCQDMREFELYGTVRAIISRCDSLNYIRELSELKEVFAWVNNYLDPNGIFIFDMNTEYKYQNILGDNTFAEVREQASFIWENTYDIDKRINEYDLNLFIKLEGDNYKKFEERHVQKAYTFDEILSAIDSSNMVLEKYLDADTYGDVSEKTERILFVAREKGK